MDARNCPIGLFSSRVDYILQGTLKSNTPPRLQAGHGWYRQPHGKVLSLNDFDVDPVVLAGGGFGFVKPRRD
jgi:hypothetical protein